MGEVKEYPKMWTKEEEFLELWEQFHCLAFFKVCSLTAYAGGTQQVIPAGLCLLRPGTKISDHVFPSLFCLWELGHACLPATCWGFLLFVSLLCGGFFNMKMPN